MAIQLKSNKTQQQPATGTDFEQQQLALLRRQKMIQALTDAAAKQQIGPGKYGKQQAVTNALSNAFGMWAGQRQDQEQAKLNKDLQVDAIRQVEAMDSPDPQESRMALASALASQNPIVRQIAAKREEERLKNMPSQKDVLSLQGYDPQSKLEATKHGRIDLNKLTPEQKEHIINGQIVRAQGQGYQPVGDFRDQFGEVGPVAMGPEGPIYGQKNEATGEAKFAPAGTKINVNTAKKAGDTFAEGLAEKRAGTIVQSYEAAQMAQKSLDSLNYAAEDLKAGIKSGAAAEISLALAKWSEALGGPNDPSVTNTEAFRANMAQQVMALVKNLGSGTAISNADLDFAKQAAGGQITLDNGSMLRLMNIGRSAAANVLVGHQNLLDKNQNATGALPQDLATFEVPFAVSFGPEDGIQMDEKSGRFRYMDPAIKAQVPTSQPKVRKYNPATGRIE